MQLSFRTLSIITSLLCFVLALAWGFFPQVLLVPAGVAGDLEH